MELTWLAKKVLKLGSHIDLEPNLSLPTRNTLAYYQSLLKKRQSQAKTARTPKSPRGHID